MATDDETLPRQLWTRDLAAEPFAAVFRKHFNGLRAAHQAQPHEGVLIAAVDGNGVFDAHAHLRLPPSGIAHLIVGRHERCDVVLSRDNDVSLRHLLLRATRGRDGRIHLRAIDLRSRCGLLSEDGRRCEAIASAGPLFLQIASYAVFLLPTGPSVRPWTRDPDGTWRGFAPRSQEIMPPPQPLKSRSAPAPGSVRLATITIQSSSQQAGDLTSTHAVWSDQLERGILVGRDDRCSHGGVDEGNLSRVHLVLLSVDDEVWAVDTASTNGTRAAGGGPFRQLLLSGETQLVLADALSLRWAPAMHAARA
ncbi:MAG TPA: FHA domain-containing protein [Myxococcales bacterium]|nr:FHA domain-containing protein [Myxococcales bacterium]